MQPLGPAAPGVVDFARNAATEIEAFSPLARLLNEANKLVRARQFRPAYRLLSPATDLYAGDTEFDYLLGIAALESGRPGEAVLALERVVVNDPDRLRARTELARAHYMLEQREIARHEFAAIAARQLPPGARKTLSRRLDSLTRVKNQPDPVYQVNAMVGFGYDDHINVNTTTDSWLLGDRDAPAPGG